MNGTGRQDESGKPAEIVTAHSAASGQYEVLSLNGKMVYETADLFAKALEKKIQKNTCYIIDVDNLERLDSTGFGVLITVAKKVAAMEGQVGFSVSNEFLKELFEIAKFDYVFPIAAKPEEAWQMIQSGFKSRISLTQY